MASWLEHRLPRISGLNLRSHGTRVTHVLNWGGFVNRSFTVSDGVRQYHLKITNDLDGIKRLKRWHAVHSVLEDGYRAPRLILWVDLSEIGFAGLLFQHVDGRTANLCADPALVSSLVELAERLHNDEDIRLQIRASGAGKVYLDHFVETYIDRFTADLEVVAASHLPFIPSALLRWMQQETDRLQETASRMRPFQQPAVEAVHGDLNEGNILLTADDWFVLDWDDLSIGDPAVDFAVALWPMVWEGRSWRDFFTSGTDEGLAERIEVCFRAQLLDEVIDPLADYIEAPSVPSKQAAVQLFKRRRHEQALEKYRTVWC